ncbi:MULTISPECIES: hypothetical protein [Breznakia]|uniref:Putative membrane protein n=1 Tax=Breznakia blatticola TaxID=1754012 RepID=A0A4R7ZC68_9FIRM|nr:MULTISPECIES: hypothetical protein [Breznakia]MDH6366395.1 putative membrane protein [Breznakia sp. PH1-1]MDH6403488.1 putative membrane protein [Breznakia sp. PF1-11]MDH6411197.1 putative membrane protein [Breznakia sp. PFB1-11]MDH6413540.1 putative membrane protein [Breznakia sp. PFB1-14]MDH6415742.1 putative membrane protein [Breznakia sp. PFB1-4]
MNLFDAIIAFFVYAFLGWVCETIYVSVGKRHFVKRGFLYGTICPIYGFGALAVLYVLDPYTYYPPLIFILGVVVTSTLEYVTSYGMEKIFHLRWWDYSTYKFNLNGRICLKNSIMFGIMALVLVYGIHPEVVELIKSLPDVTKYVLTGLLIGIFITDTTFSIVHALDINKALQRVDELKDKIGSDAELLAKQVNENIQNVREQISDKTIKASNRYSKRLEHFKESYPSLKPMIEEHRLKALESIIQTLKDANLPLTKKEKKKKR